MLKQGWKIKEGLISTYIIFLLVTVGFFGLLVIEDILNVGSVDAVNPIIVDWQGDGDYLSIQAAIDNADSGNTIYVWAGEYSENIVINKTINLIGNGTTNTTIKGVLDKNVITWLEKDVPPTR